MGAPSNPCRNLSRLSLPFWEGAHAARKSPRSAAMPAAMWSIRHDRCARRAGDDDLEWVSCSLEEERSTPTRFCHWATMPGDSRARTPYIIAIVELGDGVRLTTNVVDCAPDKISVGLKVRGPSSGPMSDTVT